MAYTPGTLTGTHKNIDGAAASGTVKITPSAPVVRDLAGHTLLSGPITVPLVAGAYSVSVPPTTGLDPSSFAYTVEVTTYASGALAPVEGIAVAAGATVYVPDLASVDTPDVTSNLAQLVGRSGTGIPEGVVTAPVGTRYVDTAATRGAVEWIKATGTGNTGWVVVTGDTGWRDITALMSGIASGTLLIRRVNGTVIVKASTLTLSADLTIGSVILNPLPAGFRPENILPLTFFKSANAGVLMLAYAYITTLNVVSKTLTQSATTTSGWAVADPITGQVSWATVQAWPTTLPGT